MLQKYSVTKHDLQNLEFTCCLRVTVLLQVMFPTSSTKAAPCVTMSVIMHATDPQLSVVRVGHCVMSAGSCLSLYSLHVLNRYVNMIQTKTTKNIQRSSRFIANDYSWESNITTILQVCFNTKTEGKKPDQWCCSKSYMKQSQYHQTSS